MGQVIPDQPGFAPDTPTDGREKGDWKTRFPREARRAILLESIYLGVIFFSVPVLLLF